MTTAASPAPVTLARRLPRLSPRRAWLIGLIAVALAAGILTTWEVAQASRSDYYAAIAVSMSRSWSNFFFGALDPAGTVTLDKIPGSFWIPALFVRVFGFSTWAVVLPNALAAVGATVLTALTARRIAGTTAGLVAGAIVATTPILVAVSRSNQPESFFVLGLAAAAWASLHAVRRASPGWLVAAGLFIAAAFQTYMLEAWALWPALAAAWLCTRQRWWRKLWTLAVAGSVSAAGSVWWIAIVSLVPASDRPYIGSTLTNSPWEMVFGYNGLGRFGATADSDAYRSFTPPFSGEPSVVRLFNEQLAGQIAWLLPAAALAIVVLWVLRARRSVTLFLAVWLVTFAAMFSIVDGMHQFYTAALAGPIALSVGIAFAWARRRRARWAQIALVATAAASALAISLVYGGFSIPVALAQVVVAAVVIALIARERGRRSRRGVIAVLAAIALVLTPLSWSIVTIAHPSSLNPVAGGVSDFGGGLGGGRSGGGPGAGFGADGRDAGMDAGASGGMAAPPAGMSPPAGAFGGARDDGGSGAAGFGGGLGGASVDQDVLAYLTGHAGDDRYLAATFGAQEAAGYILASDGGSFLPIGGFDGGDDVPTLARFEQLVADGDLTYVLMSQQGGPGRTSSEGTSAEEIRAWVQANCAVPSDSPSRSLYACTG